MLRIVIRWSVVILVLLWASGPVWAAAIPIGNASFEAPAVDPNAFPAIPFVDQWFEIDMDVLGSTNTGVFANTPVNSDDHVANAHGNQLAFLNSIEGNALKQDLEATYRPGYDYQLTLAVGVSGMLPPSVQEPVDTLELVLYYVEDGNSVDVARRVIPATGLSSTQLQDFSLYLPSVSHSDAWAHKTIGVAIRAAGMAYLANGMPGGGFWDLDHVRLTESVPLALDVANPSFEAPVVDPNSSYEDTNVDKWIELDVDASGSTNTGVFANTAADSNDHVVNANGQQLAFLESAQGNALEQDLHAAYNIGCSYHLSLAVGVSGMFPPSSQAPVDTLELVLYYVDDVNTVDIVRQIIAAPGLSSTLMQDFSVHLPTVRETDAWAGKAMGVAIRAMGLPGGFWDLDNLRLLESMPAALDIANASFEAPAVDPNAFPALPVVDQWIEADLDALGSTNTGVFANSPSDMDDHVINADGGQLAFLGSEQGNALEQDLPAVYEVGCAYRFTVAVGVSGRFPPAAQEAVDKLDLMLYYIDDGQAVDMVAQSVPATGLSSTKLQDFSVYLPTVDSTDAWADKVIGVALRAAGVAGGFWDLDHVRLAKSLPVVEGD
jgi:hypothetical protein